MEIRLRKLKEKDVEGMLEWMHNKEIQKSFRKPMLLYTREMALEFIRKARYELIDGGSIHFAIVDDLDEYLGTISLKEIDMQSYNAEYAIVLRESMQGKGYAKNATKKLLKKGFHEYGLQRIYLNVLSDNVKAQKFYEKCGFLYEGEARKSVVINKEFCSIKWYSILREEYEGN